MTSGTGKQIRLSRLFSNRDGRAVVFAFDHGMQVGPVPGAVDLRAGVALAVEARVRWHHSGPRGLMPNGRIAKGPPSARRHHAARPDNDVAAGWPILRRTRAIPVRSLTSRTPCGWVLTRCSHSCSPAIAIPSLRPVRWKSSGEPPDRRATGECHWW